MKQGEVIEKMLTGIFSARPINDTKKRLAVWEKCWAENASAPYFGQQAVCRVGDAIVADPELEHQMFCDLRTDLYDKYLRGITEVSEFGCGVGDNLKAIRGNRTLRGFDWSRSAVKKCRERGIDAQRFNMLTAPDKKIKLSGAVITVHAMEQLGNNWLTFFNFLLSQKVLVIHIEPMVELYDEHNLMDFLAFSYHMKRGYLSEYLPNLQRLDGKKIKLLEVRKSAFGNLHHMAYSVVVWKPL